MFNNLGELLAAAPAGRHFAQLYRAFDPVGQAVGTFLDGGLEPGKAVVLIATGEHEEFFLDGLSDAGRDPRACEARGQLIMLDAERMLARFMEGELPSWTAFERLMTGVFEEVRQLGATTVRAYGEMVDVLLSQARTDAALALEQLWNRLSTSHAFCLFCAHQLDAYPAGVGGAMHELCTVHSDVIVTNGESFRSREGLGVEIGEVVDESGEMPRTTTLWLMGDLPALGGAT